MEDVYTHSLLVLLQQIEWSRDWAISMRDEPPSDDNAPFCDSVRKCLLLFLDRLRECALDASNSAVSEASIVDTMQGHRIVNVVKVVLPMEFAWCRYTRQYPGDVGTDRYGMRWYSEEDAQNDPWRAFGPATMPPSFPWLRDVEGLRLQQENLVVDWMRPCVPDWVPDELDDDDVME